MAQLSWAHPLQPSARQLRPLHQGQALSEDLRWRSLHGQHELSGSWSLLQHFHLPGTHVFHFYPLRICLFCYCFKFIHLSVCLSINSAGNFLSILCLYKVHVYIKHKVHICYLYSFSQPFLDKIYINHLVTFTLWPQRWVWCFTSTSCVTTNIQQECLQLKFLSSWQLVAKWRRILMHFVTTPVIINWLF